MLPSSRGTVPAHDRHRACRKRCDGGPAGCLMVGVGPYSRSGPCEQAVPTPVGADVSNFLNSPRRLKRLFLRRFLHRVHTYPFCRSYWIPAGTHVSGKSCSDQLQISVDARDPKQGVFSKKKEPKSVVRSSPWSVRAPAPVLAASSPFFEASTDPQRANPAFSAVHFK